MKPDKIYLAYDFTVASQTYDVKIYPHIYYSKRLVLARNTQVIEMLVNINIDEVSIFDQDKIIDAIDLLCDTDYE